MRQCGVQPRGIVGQCGAMSGIAGHWALSGIAGHCGPLRGYYEALLGNTRYCEALLGNMRH